MNTYTLDDIYVGMTEHFAVFITQDMQDAFTALSGDVNPIHLDSDFAISRGRGYRDKLVYGMCTASFYSTLVGVYLPGKNCLFHECNVAFPGPVYIGDTLTVAGIVKEVDRMFRRIYLKASITNQDGVKVSRARLTVGVLE